MDIIAPFPSAKMPALAARIPRDIAALFAACAVPGLVDLGADPKTVSTGALFPCEAALPSAVSDLDFPKQAESGHARAGLRQFDRSTHRGGSNNLITGDLHGGKTVLLKYLLCSHGNRWDVVVAMCPALESQDALRQMFPASCVHDKYDPAVINKIVSTAHALRQTGFRPRVLLVLDDCMLDRQGASNEMRDLYVNSHYLGIEVYNVAPYTVDIPEAWRYKVDYAFIVHEPRQTCRMALYKSFGTVFPTYEEFLVALDDCTENFGCMVVDNARAAGAAADRIFCDRASLDSSAAPLGSRAQWLLHHMFYNGPKHAAKGTVMATLKPQQIISANEHCAQADRRGLCLKTQGRYIYTPWSDIEGRPLLVPSADTLPVSVSASSIGINVTVEEQDTTKCKTRDCQNSAQFKCYFCKKIICLHHHSRMNYSGVTIDTCPMCVCKVANHRILFALFRFAFAVAVVAVFICLVHRETP